MKVLLKFFILFLINFNLSYARNVYILMGGGGEPVKAIEKDGKVIQGTIFDSNLESVVTFLKGNKKWDHEIFFNGNHPKTEKILSDNILNLQSDFSFSSSNYKNVITKYENLLQNGELKNGDQIVIHILTHGSSKKLNQLSHSISTSDDENNIWGESGNLDEVKRLADLANTKGVKLAIIDQSCHSGNTLSLANPNTCVISATGPNHFGYIDQKSDFVTSFNKHLLAEKNLEEIYIKARLNSTDAGFPMISTQEGIEIQEQIYPLLTPYLYFFEKNYEKDKLTNYIMQNTQSICSINQSFYELNKIIQVVEDLNTVTKKVLFMDFKNKKVNLDDLKKSINEYYDFQSKTIEGLNNVNLNLLNKREQFETNVQGVIRSMNYSWENLLTANFPKRIEELEKELKYAFSPGEKLDININIEIYKKAYEKALEISKAHPELMVAKEQFNNLRTRQTKSFELAWNIGKQSRALYDALYAERKIQNSLKSSNPCKDFYL